MSQLAAGEMTTRAAVFVLLFLIMYQIKFATESKLYASSIVVCIGLSYGNKLLLSLCPILVMRIL